MTPKRKIDDQQGAQRQQLLEAALLLEANEHLSAAASALRARASNRHAAKIILLDLLGMDETELEKLYWEKQS